MILGTPSSGEKAPLEKTPKSALERALPLLAWGLLFLLAGPNFSKRPISLDESVWFLVSSQKSLSDVLDGIIYFNHLPLWCLYFHSWFKLGLDHSLFAIRLPGMVLLLPFFFFFNDILNTLKTRLPIKIMILAVWATSPYVLYYASQAKYFSPLLFSFSLLIWANLKLLETKNPWYHLPLFLGKVLGLYTHYYFGLSLIGITLGNLWIYFKNKDARAGLAWIISDILAIGAFLPWFSIFSSQANTLLKANSFQYLSKHPNLLSPKWILFLFSGFFTGPHPMVLANTLPILLVYCPLALLLLVLGIRYLKNSPQPLAPILILSFFSTVFCSWFLGFSINFLIGDIYFFHFYPFLALILLYPLQTELKWNWENMARLTLMGLMLINSFAMVFRPLPHAVNMDPIAQWLKKEHLDQETILVSPPFQTYPLMYYLPKGNGLISPKQYLGQTRTNTFIRQVDVQKEFRKLNLKNKKLVFLRTALEHREDPKQLRLNHLRTTHRLVGSRNFPYQGVHVYIFLPKPPSPGP